MTCDGFSLLIVLLDFHRRTPRIFPPMKVIRSNTAMSRIISAVTGYWMSRVVFLWFNDTLPDAPIDRLAVLRLDGDMYESTIEALNALYHKVSYGGSVIVDDYF
jgi:Macrocin-O-methyltransferase (TylF)